MQIKTFGCALEGMQTTTITIELSLEKGHHRIISGLADDAVKESLARIEAAISHSGFRMLGEQNKFLIYHQPVFLKPEHTWIFQWRSRCLRAKRTGFTKRKNGQEFLISGDT